MMRFAAVLAILSGGLAVVALAHLGLLWLALLIGAGATAGWLAMLRATPDDDARRQAPRHRRAHAKP